MLALHINNNQLSIEKHTKPSRKKDYSLIKIILSGICATDVQLLSGYKKFSGIPGHEFVGKVIESDSENLIGKRVVGEINISCGECDMCQQKRETHCRKRSVLGILNHPGAHAEYITLPDKNLHVIPESMPNEIAVFMEPFAAACRILEQISIRKQDNVAIIGDGKLSFIIAQVLATSNCNLLMVGRYKNKLSLSEPFCSKVTEKIESSSFGKMDIVIESTGNPSGMISALKLLKPRGCLIVKSTYVEKLEFPMTEIAVNEINIIGSRCGSFLQAFEVLNSFPMDFLPLIQNIFSLKNGIAAYKEAMQKGATKILINCS